jgi:transposase-like protein
VSRVGEERPVKKVVKLNEFGSSLAATKNRPLGDRRLARAVDPEVLERPRRRKFGAEYKVRILREAERAKESGQLGALLRREGLYTSNLTTWRRQFERGALAALAPKKRGKKAKPVDARDTRIRELERDNERLRKRLEQAETIIEVQKKVSALLGTSSPGAGDETS